MLAAVGEESTTTEKSAAALGAAGPDHSWDRAAAEYEKIYRRLVAEREGIRIAEFA